jgi:RHS repeat-associated protein
MRNLSLKIVGAILLLLPMVSVAQVQWGQEYDRQLKTRKTPATFGTDQFGDSVNLYDGTVSFGAQDLEIPGNSSLSVAVSRSFSVGNPKNAASDGLFGNWNMSLPYVGVVSDGGAPLGQTPNPNFLWPAGASHARCSTTNGATPELGGTSGGGSLFRVDAQTPKKLVRPDAPGMHWVSKSFWYFSCTSNLASGQPGEGFVGIDPSGRKYTFDWMVTHFYPGSSLPGMGMNQIQVHRADVRLYPTRVEDRFGNWVSYRWQGRRLLAITANDGRRVDFAYGADDQIIQATAQGRTWTYSYVDYTSAGSGGRLTAVTNPDGTRWSFGQDPGNYVDFEPKYELRRSQTPGGTPMMREYEVLEKVARCSYDHYLSGTQKSFEVTHPTGAKAVFAFKTMRHGRTGVPAKCEYGWGVGGDGGVSDAQNSQNMFPAFKVVMSLQNKRVTGPGLTPTTWRYEYSNLGACVGDECSTDPAAARKQVVVIAPDGDRTVSTFGKQFGENEGQLLSTQILREGVVASRTEYGYVSNAQAALMPFPAVVGQLRSEYPETWMEAAIRPLSDTITVQGGVTYIRSIDAYDAFSRPVTTVRENTNGHTRTDVAEYHNDLAHWVIGQPARQYNVDTGLVESRVEYNDKALPWKSYRFGKLQSTSLYNIDGTLASVADGRGNVTIVSDWKRGSPQKIRYPATPESPQGAVESGLVDDHGWLVAHTDEAGSTTRYDYDQMGRLTRIKYPTGDAVDYNDTTFELAMLNDADALPPGVTAGQWYRAEKSGAARKIEYLDTMFRPVLEHVYQDGSKATTLSAKRTTYDTDGRVSFTSYPSSHLGAGDLGVRSHYDALGRVTRLEQDSEHGPLVTTSEYLTGLGVRTTDPQGHQTTTRYMAWDEPAYELPTGISYPEDKTVEILRHPQLGVPLQVTQRSADGKVRQDRRYVYDEETKLCKTIEPETGVTVLSYDEVGNLAWSAGGLDRTALGSNLDCGRPQALSSGRATQRGYDALGRLISLSFPDGRGNQTLRYTADGLPASITTYNDANNGSPVVNAYTYNKRRMLVGESVAQPGWYSWGIGYGYDANASLATQTYPTGLVVDYAPNALGQPTRAGNYATGVQYYPNGAIKQFTYGNGIVHTMSQNGRQLPMRVKDGTNVLDHEYAYDRNGNPTSIIDSIAGSPVDQHRYMQYDKLNRLKAAGSQMFGGDNWHRFSYDALDNLTSWTLAGVKDYANYVYDGSNRLTNIKDTAGASVVGMEYDPRGNLIAKNGQRYGFDAGGRLRDVSGKASYRYDGHGRRVQEWLPAQGNVLSYYSNAGQLMYVERHLASERKLSAHVYLGGSLIATNEQSLDTGSLDTSYQHTDALGSPVAVTDARATVVERTNYDPNGSPINKVVDGIGYTGHVMDGSTGLTYMQQRYYDPAIGRFLSVDPVPAAANTGAMFNRYKYANNNPYLFTDPDGRQEHSPFAPYRAAYEGVKEGYVSVRADNARWNRWMDEAGLREVADYTGKTIGQAGYLGLLAQNSAPGKVAIGLANTPKWWGTNTAVLGGLTMGAKRYTQKVLEMAGDDLDESLAPLREAADPYREFKATTEYTPPQSGASAPKPPASAAKPRTAVQRAVETPQGKYRDRKE